MRTPFIGRRNTLTAISRQESGMMLDGGRLGEILLPNRYIPEEFEQGEEIEIFLSLDSEDRLVATTETPLATAGEFALLKVVATTGIGVFLDWGMPKDLLLPFAEQIKRLEVGDEELVYVDVDKVSRRLVASAKLRKHVESTAPFTAAPGTEVTLMFAERTDLGYKTIVDGSYWGLLRREGSKDPRIPNRGHTCVGYITRIREDGLADVSLDPPGYSKIPDAAERLAAALAATATGYLPLHDKSSPEQVIRQLGMSKKVFKQALGALYKAGKVRLTEKGTQWVEPPKP